jgi:tRNA nucleotidyltransferase (CCA-adding enzyme)
MNKYKKVFQAILQDVIPKEKEIKIIENVIDSIREYLKKKARELEIKFTNIDAQGSTGIKQTQLRNDFDIDIFIGLDWDEYKEKFDDLSKTQFKKKIKKDFRRLCLEWIFPVLEDERFENPRLLYAEHPYVQVDYKAKNYKIQIDLVLYFDLKLEYIRKNGPITAVDRSPWHGRFVDNYLSSKQINDVRLLKQFFKAQHSYGDKSPIGKIGFIGYGAELLIFHYNTILELFKNFHNLPNKELDYFCRKKKKITEITHFQDDFLLIIDPIDKNRNVASAIDERAYRFVNQKVHEFLKEPNKSFFHIDTIPEIDLATNDSTLDNIFVLEMEKIDKEVHYTEIRDKIYSLGNDIKSHGEKEYSHEDRFETILFELYFKDEINEYILVIYCKKPIISKTYVRPGPPLKNKKHAEKFKKKNPSYIQKDQRLWVEEKRDYHKFSNFLKKFTEGKVPKSLHIINLSNALGAQTNTGKKAIYLMKEMILPIYIDQGGNN